MTGVLVRAVILLLVFANLVRLDGAPWRLTEEAKAMVPQWSPR